MDLSAFMEWFHEAVCHAKGMEVSPDRLPGQQKEKGSAASPPMAGAFGPPPSFDDAIGVGTEECTVSSTVPGMYASVAISIGCNPGASPPSMGAEEKSFVSVWTPQTLKCRKPGPSLRRMISTTPGLATAGRRPSR
jgi:hypothetical protein